MGPKPDMLRAVQSSKSHQGFSASGLKSHLQYGLGQLAHFFLHIRFFLFRIKLYLRWLWCPRPLQPVALRLLVRYPHLSLAGGPGYPADVCGQAGRRLIASRLHVLLWTVFALLLLTTTLLCLVFIMDLAVFHLTPASQSLSQVGIILPIFQMRTPWLRGEKICPQDIQLVIESHLKPTLGTKHNVLPLNRPPFTHPLRHGPGLSSWMASPNQGGFLLFGLCCFSPVHCANV